MLLKPFNILAGKESDFGRHEVETIVDPSSRKTKLDKRVKIYLEGDEKSNKSQIFLKSPKCYGHHKIKKIKKIKKRKKEKEKENGIIIELFDKPRQLIFLHFLTALFSTHFSTLSDHLFMGHCLYYIFFSFFFIF